MVTESLIRKKFVHETVRESLQQIHDQWKPLSGAFRVRSGELQRFTDHPMPTVAISDKRYSVHYFLPLHLRFLDIQYRKKKARRGEGKRNLYNKIVWPVLYQHMMPQLKFGLTDEVRRTLREQLQRAAGEK